MIATLAMPSSIFGTAVPVTVLDIRAARENWDHADRHAAVIIPDAVLLRPAHGPPMRTAEAPRKPRHFGFDAFKTAWLESRRRASKAAPKHAVPALLFSYLRSNIQRALVRADFFARFGSALTDNGPR